MTPRNKRRTKPGLVLLHGNFAHAHWWTHMAPFWAKKYTVIAPSLSAHGASGWRERYDYDVWAREVAHVAKHEGLSSRNGAVLVAHSMGAIVASRLEQKHNGPTGLLLLLLLLLLHFVVVALCCCCTLLLLLFFVVVIIIIIIIVVVVVIVVWFC